MINRIVVPFACCGLALLAGCAEQPETPYIAQRGYLNTQVLTTPSQIATLAPSEQTVVTDRPTRDVPADGWQLVQEVQGNATAVSLPVAATSLTTIDLLPPANAKTSTENPAVIHHTTGRRKVARKVRPRPAKSTNCSTEEKTHG